MSLDDAFSCSKDGADYQRRGRCNKYFRSDDATISDGGVALFSRDPVGHPFCFLVGGRHCHCQISNGFIICCRSRCLTNVYVLDTGESNLEATFYGITKTIIDL